MRRAVLSIARKNGKTALIAALVLVHLVGPEAIMNGEIYSAATEREQAAQVFKVAAQMIRADPELDRELGGLLKVVDSTKTIVCFGNGSVYRAISAEAGSKHGLNPSMVIYDELAQARDRTLYDVLDTSMGAREEPLFVVISTQNPDPEHILSKLIDDGLRDDDESSVTHLYAADDEAEIMDEEAWYSANPALGDFRDLDDFRIQAERAVRMPSFESSFRNLYLNQRIDYQSPVVAKAEWKACADPGRVIQPGSRIYLGLDLSGTKDLSALVAVSADPDSDEVMSWLWKPKKLLKDHETRDRAPYSSWVSEGYLEAPDGHIVDYGSIAKKLSELSEEYEIVGLAYDRWRIQYLIKELNNLGVDIYQDGKDTPLGIRTVPWGQGFRDMTPAVEALEASVVTRKLKHPNNPVLNMCFANAIAVSDPAGGRKLDKSKSRFRIDGAVACLMAIGLKYRDVGSGLVYDDLPEDYEVTVV